MDTTPNTSAHLNRHEVDVKRIFEEQQVNVNQGLSSSEAARRIQVFGKNIFQKKKKKSIFARIISHFDVATLVLLVAGSLSLALEIKEQSNFIEPIVIFSIIIMNMTLALFQEQSAEKAIDALSTLSAPSAKVLRGGNIQEIPAADIVPGDIISLKTGDMVPADARLINAQNLAVNESSLTGESEPSQKDADAMLTGNIPLGDMLNMVFQGCLVTTGTATAIVTDTAMHTEMGKIAGFLNEDKKSKTPLQIRLDKVGKMVSSIAIMSSITMLAVGLLQGHDFWHMALVAVTLSVAAVPETLSLIVTLMLTQGVKNMAAKNALIRKLQAVETLGSTSVICSDKTGTLTMNKMAVTRLWKDGDDAPIGSESTFDSGLTEMIKMFSLTCSASIGVDADGKEAIIGDPTETAILTLLMQKGMSKTALDQDYEQVAMIPFSSERKKMTVVVKTPAGVYVMLTKGAFDRIDLDNNNLEHVTQITRIHDSFAGDALRVIALASKTLSKAPVPEELEALECGMTFEGFVGLIDPPRPEAAAAIKKARSAGIRTIMITGDHKATAAAIARELGIIAANEGVLTGVELSEMTDTQLEDSIEFYSVYARVSPEDKIRIVRAWQKRGEVVSMTGDGVNDAPALSAADVGTAMGINGTEVSKNAASMILMDDKFSTIIEAVSEGRNVFSNIKKLMYFLLVCNFSEIIVMLFSQFIGWELPLSPLTLLLINVLCDGIPGMTLAQERSDTRIMSRKPISRNESFFGAGLLEVIVRQTFVFTAITLVAFYIGTQISIGGMAPTLEIGRAMAFFVTGVSSILHILTVKSRKSIVTHKLRDNPPLYISCLAMVAFMVVLTAVPPIGAALGFAEMSSTHWLITCGFCLVPTIVAEYVKLWDNLKFKTAENLRVH